MWYILSSLAISKNCYLSSFFIYFQSQQCKTREDIKNVNRLQSVGLWKKCGKKSSLKLSAQVNKCLNCDIFGTCSVSL